MKAKRFSKVRLILLLILLAVFGVSVYKVSSQLIREKKEDNAFADLIEQVEKDRDTATQRPNKDEDTPPSEDEQKPDDPGQDQTEPVMLSAYATLYEMNPDLFGWIEIEGTKVNYPVMYTPKDSEYYLRRAFDGSYSYSGVPFVDGRCVDGCGIYLVYGHNMKNGTMFTAITNYSKESFWKEHPTIRFDTLYEEGTYEVLAAFYSKVYNASDVGAFRYYNYANLSDPKVFAEYMDQVKASAIYDTGIEAVYGDQILTLSTCEYHTTDGRFVVVARKTRD